MNSTSGMNKRILVVLLLAGTMSLSILLTGCGNSKPQTATLALSSNPTTGYSWRVEQDPEIFDITSEYVEDEAEEDMVGVGGTETFTLTPKKKGKTTVNFYYEQSWDQDSTETRLTYQLSVDRNMQIKVEAQSGALPGDTSTMPQMPELVIQ